MSVLAAGEDFFDFNKMPYGTKQQFRNWLMLEENSFYVNDLKQSGVFTWDPNDTTSSDDDIMVMIKDGKRFKRDVNGFVSINFFKVVNDGVETTPNVWQGTDNSAKIQAAFDFASDRGLALMIEEGDFMCGNTLEPKRVNGKEDYCLTIIGKGQGISNIRGMNTGLAGKNLFQLTKKVGDSNKMTTSNFQVRDVSFYAGSAKRAFYAEHVVHIAATGCDFWGGTEGCFQTGDGTNDISQFGLYLSRCYFNGGIANDAHNTYLIKNSNYYSEIYFNVGDGSKYGLITTGVQNLILGNTFEGYKYIGIDMQNSGGGRSKIALNTLRPYARFESSGIFNGTIYGIRIHSISGGVYGNVISANEVFVPMPEDLDIVTITEQFDMVPSPHESYKIIGQTSGAQAQVVGYNATDKRMNLQMIGSTQFTIGENIKQNTTNKTAKISSFVERHSYALSMTGVNGLNAVTGNLLEAEWCIISDSPNNTITGNILASTHHGISFSNHTVIVGNTIATEGTADHIAVRRVGTPIYQFVGNGYTGRLEGITLDAGSESYLKNTGNQVLDGTLMMNSFSANSSKTSGSGGFQIKADGLNRWSIDRFVPEAATGNANRNSNLAISRYRDDGTYIDTPFQIDRETAEIYTLKFPTCDGVPTVGKQLVNKNYVDNKKAAAVNDYTPVASGGNPTKAEFDTLRQELRDLKASMRTAGLLA